MPSTDPFAGYTPPPNPPVAPDGGLALEPAISDPLAELPIGLCSIGPCSRYHLLEAQVDAEAPIDGSPARIHLTVIRTCYPSPGIEMAIEMAIHKCSLWDPIDQTLFALKEKARDDHRFGSQWDAFMASWEQPQDDPPPTAAVLARRAKLVVPPEKTGQPATDQPKEI